MRCFKGTSSDFGVRTFAPTSASNASPKGVEAGRCGKDHRGGHPTLVVPEPKDVKIGHSLHDRKTIHDCKRAYSSPLHFHRFSAVRYC